MELLHYLFKSSLVLSLFFAVYSIFLKKDTQFQWHRWFLVAGVLLSYTIPLIVFTRIIHITAPVTGNNTSFIATGISAATKEIHWSQYMVVFYILGLFVMSLRFLKQCYSLYKIIHNSTAATIDGSPYQKTTIKCMPFSFFKYIVINRKLHSKEELSMILIHENIHSSQYHTLDILLSNLLLIGQWWNPMAWFYKKSMEENLEFIADAGTIKTTACAKTYQYTLVKNTVETLQPALATHFYQSLIKKRILMLNKPTSNNINRWKTIVILPLIALFMWSFNVEEKTAYLQKNNEPLSYIVTPETSNSELKSIEVAFEPNKIQLKFTDIKRNKDDQIIQISIKTRQTSAKNFVKRMSIKKQDNKVIKAFKLQLDPVTSDIILNTLDKEDKSTTIFTETSTLINNIGITSSTQDNIKKTSSPKKLYILDGKEVPSKIIEEIKEQIGIINVLKGSNATKKYGIKGKNGVMEITLKSNTKSIPKNTLYIVDGKETNTADNIPPNTIKDISVLKGKKATDLYGKKGENGVIIITTKKEKQ